MTIGVCGCTTWVSLSPPLSSSLATEWLFSIATLQDKIIEKVIRINSEESFKEFMKLHLMIFISQRIYLKKLDTLNTKETIKLTWQIGKLKDLAEFDWWTVYL